MHKLLTFDAQVIGRKGVSTRDELRLMSAGHREPGAVAHRTAQRELGSYDAEYPSNLQGDRGHRDPMPKDRSDCFDGRRAVWPIMVSDRRQPVGLALLLPVLPRRGSALFGAALVASLLLVAGCGTLLPAGIFDKGMRFGGASAPTEEQQKMTAQAQRILTDLGYQPGEADGLAGPKTREAIRQFQADSHMPEDGEVSPALLKRLAIAVDVDRGIGGTDHVNGAELPTYELGSTFVYSDGIVETVIGLDGQRARWRNNRGDTFTADRNFVVPWLSWYSDGRSGERLVQGQPESLWPLKVGQEASFTVQTRFRRKDQPENVRKTLETWDCKVEGMARISVVAGVFSTLIVTCNREMDDRSPALTRVWYYAPGVGRIVRMNDFYNVADSDRHVELVTVRPGAPNWPPAARAGLGWALEDALENLRDGAATQWSSSGVDVRVNIRMGKRFERGDGKQCRTFMQTWQTEKQRRSYPGTACRDSFGRWKVPGLEYGKDGSLAVSDGVS